MRQLVAPIAATVAIIATAFCPFLRQQRVFRDLEVRDLRFELEENFSSSPSRVPYCIPILLIGTS
jgi:hypothetical protein